MRQVFELVPKTEVLEQPDLIIVSLRACSKIYPAGSSGPGISPSV
jgi:hypothetical protein